MLTDGQMYTDVTITMSLRYESRLLVINSKYQGPANRCKIIWLGFM